MSSWYEQIKSGKFPTCPEICMDCVEGKHIFHIFDELSNFYATKEIHPNYPKHNMLVLKGSCEDELCLEQLFQMIGCLYPLASHAK